MEYLACPSCGSIYIVSARSGGKSVFHVNEQREPVAIEHRAQRTTTLDVDFSQIFCGACSWSGKIDQLVPSHM